MARNSGPLKDAALTAVSRIGQRRQVVIPKGVLEAVDLKEGDYVEITARAGRLSMRRQSSADPDDVLTPAEVLKVQHALTQVAEGKTKPWSEVRVELDY